MLFSFFVLRKTIVFSAKARQSRRLRVHLSFLQRLKVPEPADQTRITVTGLQGALHATRTGIGFRGVAQLVLLPI
jgi:hypothetical protein